MAERIGLMQRLIRHCVIDLDTGCWNWSAAIGNHGYGVIRLRENGKSRAALAHRVSYEKFIGPFPAGKFSDHLCRNRRCINPYHIEPVTNAENTRRGEAGLKTGELMRNKTHCPKGHPYEGDNLKLSMQGGGKYQHRACRICRAEDCRRYRAKKKQPQAAPGAAVEPAAS